MHLAIIFCNSVLQSLQKKKEYTVLWLWLDFDLFLSNEKRHTVACIVHICHSLQ